jgi:hypothetical protein
MGCEALCKALKVAGSSGLKELNLSHLPLDDRAAAAVAALLSSSRVLERLLMTHSNITDAGAQLICNALQVCVRCMILKWRVYIRPNSLAKRYYQGMLSWRAL